MYFRRGIGDGSSWLKTFGIGAKRMEGLSKINQLRDVIFGDDEVVRL